MIPKTFVSIKHGFFTRIHLNWLFRLPGDEYKGLVMNVHLNRWFALHHPFFSWFKPISNSPVFCDNFDIRCLHPDETDLLTSMIGNTPPKTNILKLKITPFEKEHHLPNLHFGVQNVSFQGCIM